MLSIEIFHNGDKNQSFPDVIQFIRELKELYGCGAYFQGFVDEECGHVFTLRLVTADSTPDTAMRLLYNIIRDFHGKVFDIAQGGFIFDGI